MNFKSFKSMLKPNELVLLKKDAPFEYGLFKGEQDGKILLWMPNTNITYKMKNSQIDMVSTLNMRKKPFDINDIDLDLYDMVSL